MENLKNLSTRNVIKWLCENWDYQPIIVCDSDDLDLFEAINRITKICMETTENEWSVNITECEGSILIF